jgi:hypothetical protein
MREKRNVLWPTRLHNSVRIEHKGKKEKEPSREKNTDIAIESMMYMWVQCLPALDALYAPS